jgi:hypothetical protein
MVAAAMRHLDASTEPRLERMLKPTEQAAGAGCRGALHRQGCPGSPSRRKRSCRQAGCGRCSRQGPAVCRPRVRWPVQRQCRHARTSSRPLIGHPVVASTRVLARRLQALEARFGDERVPARRAQTRSSPRAGRARKRAKRTCA